MCLRVFCKAFGPIHCIHGLCRENASRQVWSRFMTMTRNHHQKKTNGKALGKTHLGRHVALMVVVVLIVTSGCCVHVRPFLLGIMLLSRLLSLGVVAEPPYAIKSDRGDGVAPSPRTTSFYQMKSDIVSL